MTRVLALVCCAAGFLLSHTASAKPKVALTQIEGDASGDIRDAVAEALEGKELSLIGSREVNRAVDKIGDLADLTEKDFKKLASDLEADAIVAGKLEKVGSARTLKFRLFVHKKMAKGFTVSFKDPKSEKFRSMLHNKMLDKIAPAAGEEEEEDRPAKKAKATDEEDPLASKKAGKKTGKKAGKAAEAEEEDVRPAKKAGKSAEAEEEDARPAKKAGKAAEAEDDARPAKKAGKTAEAEDDARPAKKAKAADEDARPAGDDEARSAKAGDEDDPPRKANKKKVAAADDGEEIEGGLVATAEPRRSANRAAIRLDVGASVQQRRFKFNSNIRNQPKNVSISPVPGARIEAEIYPLGLSSSKQGLLAGIGAAIEYDKTLRENLTTTNTATNMSFSVPVKQSNFSLGLRYRLAFGKTETSPTLTLGVDYGKRLFSTDLSKLDATARTDVRRDTPETDYTMIQPGLMFRLPVTRLIAFSAGGRGLVVTDAGPIGKAETSYGRAKVYGFDGVAAVDVVIGSRFAIRFSGEIVQFGFSFLGGGALSSGLDGDLMTKEVGGLADRSIGGSATLAVMY